MTPTLCVVHDAIGTSSAIAKIAMTTVQQALRAGWKVSVVAKYLDESLQDQVEWLKLFVPPKVFLVKWLVARAAISRALGDRKFDVLHCYQPQICSLSDVMHLQFLTRVAYERNSFDLRPGLRPAMIRAQEHGVLHAEDYFFRRWNPRTRMLFCSELMRREFSRLYGPPSRQDILVNPVPPARFPDAETRKAARKKYLGTDHEGIVLGFMGGLQERKGYRPLLDAVAKEPDIFLLMGGQFSEGFTDPRLAGRMKSVGHVSDIASFYAACDVFTVPSYFDPCPLVCFEAAAGGCGVIATEGVGNVHTLMEYGAGTMWNPAQPIGPIVRDLAARREECNRGARRMSEELSEQQYGIKLLGIYDQILSEKSRLIRKAS